ncbi:MAG: DCC1-like thiol-disulfide oxidoreductase family protein [bacterium]
MRAAAVRIVGCLSQEHWLVGASLTRISLGIWGLYYLILHWPVRSALYGSASAWPVERMAETTLPANVFRLATSDFSLDVLYFVAIVVAATFALGWHARVTGAMYWLIIWSIHERNPLVADGGDNIMRIVLLFLVLVNTSAFVSLDALRRRRSLPRGTARGTARVRAFLAPTIAVVHNFGVLLILGQLCLLYISTGLYKVMGELWQNGTAVYYILRVDEYSWPGVAEFFYRNPYVIVGATYGTVLFELLFAPAMLNRFTRHLVLTAGVGFHVSIAFIMGLITFGWSMLSYYPLFVTDREYDSLVRRVNERFRLLVFYDGWCSFCVRSIRWLRRFDILGLIRYVSFRDDGVIERYDLDPRRAESRILGRDEKGRVTEGIVTLIKIALRCPPLWPTVLLLVPAYLLMGQGAYDVVADRRVILVPGGCASHCDPEARRRPANRTR